MKWVDLATDAKEGDGNDGRAARALLANYPEYDGDGVKYAVADTLTDLRHLCDLMGLPFAELDRMAHDHYLREIAEHGPAENPDLVSVINKELE